MRKNGNNDMKRNRLLICLLALTAALALFMGLQRTAEAQFTAPRLVVSCYLSDSMTVVDARTVRIIGNFSVGSNPERLVTSPDNKFLAVAQPKNGCISIVATDNMRYGSNHSDPQILKPVDLAFSPDGGRLYVLDAETCQLAELHVPSLNVIRTLPLNGLGPTCMRISKNGAKMFVGHEDTGLITIVDLFAWEVVKQTGVAPKLGGIDLTPDNGRLLVTLPTESQVGIYKTTDLRLLSKVPVGSGAGAVGVSAKNQVIVLNTISNDVTIFPIDRPTLRFRTAVGVGPRHLCFSPDGTMCYVANFNTEDMSVIDVDKGTQLGRLAVGKGPRAITWVY